MVPSYKLKYFHAKYATEAVRFLFTYGGIDFEDVVIKREEWPQLKEKTPFGQVPVLVHNDKEVGQSVAICRYVGNIVNLAGNDAWENLEIDAVVDTLNDMRSKITQIHREEEAKQEILKEAVLKFYFTRLDAIVKKNQGFLALGRLTWADFYFASMCTQYDFFVVGNPFEKYPNLQALRAKVEALPAVAKVMEAHKKNDF